MRAAVAPAVFLFSLTVALAGSPTSPQFDIWTVENGLPQNSVTSILQGRDGYLWLTTFDGLVRFDGVNFSVFNTANSPGMKTNRLVQLFEDRAGTLWIVTEHAGLTVRENGKFRTYTTADGLPSNNVIRLRDLDDGSVLVETADGLARFRNGKLLPYNASEKFADFGYPVAPGIVWHRDAGGLHRVIEGHSMEDVSLNGAPPVELGGLFEDSRHDLWTWVRNQTGLWQWHTGAWKSYPTDAHVRIVAEDPGGTVWMGSVEGSLGRLEGDRIVFTLPSPEITGEMIHALASDREKGFWAGSSVLMRLRTPFIDVYSVPEGLRSAKVYPVIEDRQNRMWVGQWRGLTVLDNGRPVAMNFPPELATGATTSLFEDRSGNVWIGELNGGLWQNPAGSRQFLPVRDFEQLPVYAMAQDRDGDLWVGTTRGLYHYDGVNQPRAYTTADGLADLEIRSLTFARDGALWIGTLAGLDCLRDGKIGVVAEVPRTQIRTIYQDAEGVLWVGTYDRGMVRLAHGKSTAYGTEQGLPGIGVFQVLEDGAGRFWISSNAGIYRVNRSDLEGVAAGKLRGVTAVLYGRREGMRHVECNGGTQPAGVRAHDGRLWFPTQNGVAVLDPTHVPENPQPPPVKIESCLLDHEPVPLGSGVRVDPGKSDIEIHYTAISFVQPEHVRFRYQLEPLDENWVDAGSRRVVYYSHVPPGKYRFRVIAANSDGVWNLAGAALPVIVAPPFWRTWWFTAMAAVLLVGTAIWLYQWRVRSLNAARLAQESFARQVVASQEKERKRIAAELHDGLGQNLQVIKNWALLGADANTGKRLQEIAEIASQSIEEVREIARNLRPHQLDELGLTQALRSIVTRIGPSSPVHFSIACDPVDGLFDKDREINLYRIVQESVNNVLKHSEASEAEVRIVRHAGQIAITIADNGKGFNVEATRSDPNVGSGLAGMVERARMIGGSVSISATPGRGSSILLTIPL